MGNTFERPQDKMYEHFRRCSKSHDGHHHFIPVKEGRKDSSRLQCAHCNIDYDVTLHNPPDGYIPSK